MYVYEKEYYDDLLRGKSHLNALDFYVLNPKATYRRLKRPEIDKVACLSYIDGIVNEGNDLYDEDTKFKFFKFNDDAQDVESVLEKAMEEMEIDGFDFVNLTMAIMDMKNPFKILKRIKRFIKPGGVMYVRDVDDGVVFAYPDTKGLFAQFKEFYKLDSLSGSRYSARQVYNIMKKIGAKEIKLLRCGLNTSDMDYTLKRQLFDAFFSFVPNDFKRILKENPDNEAARDVLAWIDENYDDMEEEFFNDDFLFNSGYMFFSVKF